MIYYFDFDIFAKTYIRMSSQIDVVDINDNTVTEEAKSKSKSKNIARTR